MHQLHPGAKWLFRIGLYTSLLILAIFAAVFGGTMIGWLVGDPIVGISTWVICIILFVIIVAEIYARLAYRFWLYEFTPDQLKMETGIIWKKYSNVPYARIQNVDIQRGIIARILGFSSVHLQTAGYSAPARGGGSEGYIPAVSKEEAEKIREFIIKKISKKGKNKGL